jgi:hypothetical protein
MPMGPSLIALFSLAALAQEPTPVDCPLPTPEDLVPRVRCLSFNQPVDHTGPSVGSVQIPVAIVGASVPSSSRDSILFLMGGNGAGLRLLERQREVIVGMAGKREVVDHCESGYSKPYHALTLDCGQRPLSVLSDRVNRFIEKKSRER